jgi:hypothetical protein
MDKYAAGKIEGMLFAARRQLELVAAELRETTPVKKRYPRVLKVGKAMAELVEPSWEIYDEHPELNPDLEAERAAALRQAADLRRKQGGPRPRKASTTSSSRSKQGKR